MCQLNFDARGSRALMLIGLCFILPIAASARITGHLWTFEEMFAKADLVLIGKVVSTADMDERDVLLGNIKVVGVITQFGPRLILKGPKNIKNIQLHHYRLENSADVSITNGPELVQVGRPGSTYLLFLMREKTGNYAPVTGQTDPAMDSVTPLRSAAE